MLPRFYLNDFSTVGHYLGTILVITGLLMLVPAAVGLALGELSCAVDFLDGAGITALVGGLLRLLKYRRLDRRRSLLLCGIAWLVVGVFAAIPLYASGGFSSYLDALFDAVSSLTTTGVTLNSDIEHMSCAQITWRSILSLVGGVAIIVVALYLGFFGEGGYSARDNAKARHDSMSRSLRDTGRFLWIVAGSIVIASTIVVFVLLMLKGAPLKEALLNGFWLASSAYSTGSFVPHTSSLIFYHSNWLDAFLAAVMLLGAVNFGIFGMVLRKDAKLLRRNSELRAYIVWVFVLAVLVTIILCREGVYSTATGLFTHGGFMAVASATTTGMQTVYPEQLGRTLVDGAFIILMAASFLGACSASSGGGLKMFRALQLIRWFGYSIKRTLYPDRIQVNVGYHHFGPKRMISSDAMVAMVITSLYIAFAAVGSMLFIAHGYDALSSVSEAVSYVSNAGLTTGITDASMSVDLKIWALILMYLGRLEFIAIIAVLSGLIMSLNPKRSRWVQKLRGKVDDFRAGKAFKGALSVLLCLALAGFASQVIVPTAASAASTGAEVAASDLPALSFTQSYRHVTVNELLNASIRMDGDCVEVTGEAIGYAVTANATSVWVNILSDGKMIGVLMSKESAQAIGKWGSYCTHGDTITVQGVFNVACQSHSGELEVHVSNVKRILPGYNWQKPADTSGFVRGLIMLILGIGLAAAESLMRLRGGIRYRLRHFVQGRYNARSKASRRNDE